MEPATELRQFLAALWPTLQGQWVLFWGAPSLRSLWVQTIGDAEIQRLMAWSAHENVYVGCGLRARNHGPTDRGGYADVVAIPGLWLDLDYGTEHKKQRLPPSCEDAQALLDAMGLPPSIVIHSGRGLQAWWLFRELWTFDTEEERATAERLTKAWSSTLRAHAAARQWDADQVGDLPRVMRLPGTWNRKALPIATRLLSLTEARYNPGDFEAYLTGEPAKEKVEHLTWTFDLSPQAEPPNRKLVSLLDNNPQFRATYLDRRTDLADDSQSSLDMALANHTYAAGWSAQDIVNLLIAHRRDRGREPKLRRDYYEATLNRAASSKHLQEQRQMVAEFQAGRATVDDLAIDPSKYLAFFSLAIGINVTKFIRYRGDANEYELEVDGRAVPIRVVDDLLSHRRFTALILDRTDHLIPKVNADKWRQLIQGLFKVIQEVSAGTEGTILGNLRSWIDQYLTMNPVNVDAEDWKGLAASGRPFQDRRGVWISRDGLLRYTNVGTAERVSARQMALLLKRLNYENEVRQWRAANGEKLCRSFWLVAPNGRQ